jgi:fatty acid desaturase
MNPPTIQTNSRTHRTITLSSPLPGREQFLGREDITDPTKFTADGYVKLRALNDNIPNGLWKIHDDIYNLTPYLDQHPGGRIFLERVQGSDCTEAFEAHHIQPISERLLKQYRIPTSNNDNKIDNHRRFTYDGMWLQVKTRIAKALVDMGNPSGNCTNGQGLIYSTVVIQYLLVLALAGKRKSIALAMLAGFLSTGVWGVGHNFLHQSRKQKWAFLRYAVDLTPFSHDEQTVTHALSHHLFPNLFMDIEVYAFRVASVYWLTNEKDISALPFRLGGFPIFFMIFLIVEPIMRVIKKLASRTLDSDVVVKLGTLFMLTKLSGSIRTAMKLMAIVYGSMGLTFLYPGLSVHHAMDDTGAPFAFHEGEGNGKRDFSEHQIQATCDHSTHFNQYLSLLCFGYLNHHTMHHLFPSIDHCYHKELLQILLKENVGGFGDLYKRQLSTSPQFGGERSFWKELVPGLLRFQIERDFKVV